MKKMDRSTLFDLGSFLMFTVAIIMIWLDAYDFAALAIGGAIYCKLCEISYVIREK